MFSLGIERWVEIRDWRKLWEAGVALARAPR